MLKVIYILVLDDGKKLSTQKAICLQPLQPFWWSAELPFQNFTVSINESSLGGVPDKLDVHPTLVRHGETFFVEGVASTVVVRWSLLNMILVSVCTELATEDR